MLTTVSLSPKVQADTKTIEGYEVRIYTSDDVIPFSLRGKQWTKVYKTLVQTVEDGKEVDLMGYYVKLTEEQIKEQFKIIEQNVKDNNFLHNKEQRSDKGSSQGAFQRTLSKLFKYFR